MSLDHYDSSSLLFLEAAFDTLDQVRKFADLANEQGNTELCIALMRIMKDIAQSIDNADQSTYSEVNMQATPRLRA